MDYEITNTITPEEYLEMRTSVGWGGFPLELPKAKKDFTKNSALSSALTKILARVCISG